MLCSDWGINVLWVQCYVMIGVIVFTGVLMCSDLGNSVHWGINVV